jgi:hypothetical protein
MFAAFQNIMPVIVAFSGLLVAIIALVSFISTSIRQRETEKNSIYQRLELASIEFFRWESENRKELSEKKKEYPNDSDEDKKLVETYYTQAMNLFELCIHNKKTQTLPGNVFGSWLPWIYEFAHELGFDKMWPEIRLNYLPECRKVMECAIKNKKDDFIIEMCKEYGLKTEDWVEYEVNR